MTEPAELMSFIVRLHRDEWGRLSGVLERVRTGEKHQVNDVEAIGALMARLVDEEPHSPDGPGGA